MQCPDSTVTFTKHIAPIFNQHCVACHRAGQVAPFALTSYDEVAGWAETIAEVVAGGRMPPWFANPEYGHFLNDARLSDSDKSLIATWVDNGCPQGDKADLPEPPKFVDGLADSQARPGSQDAQALRDPGPWRGRLSDVRLGQGRIPRGSLGPSRGASAGQSQRACITWLCSITRPEATKSIRPRPLLNMIAGFASRHAADHLLPGRLPADSGRLAS